MWWECNTLVYRLVLDFCYKLLLLVYKSCTHGARYFLTRTYLSEKYMQNSLFLESGGRIFVGSALSCSFNPCTLEIISSPMGDLSPSLHKYIWWCNLYVRVNICTLVWRFIPALTGNLNCTKYIKREMKERNKTTGYAELLHLCWQDLHNSLTLFHFYFFNSINMEYLKKTKKSYSFWIKNFLSKISKFENNYTNQRRPRFLLYSKFLSHTFIRLILLQTLVWAFMYTEPIPRQWWTNYFPFITDVKPIIDFNYRPCIIYSYPFLVFLSHYLLGSHENKQKYRNVEALLVGENNESVRFELSTERTSCSLSIFGTI